MEGDHWSGGDGYCSGAVLRIIMAGEVGLFASVPEIVLKTSTKYLFRLTNVSGGAIKASMQLGWFEDV